MSTEYFVIAPDGSDSPESCHPSTIALQPSGPLNCTTSPAFQSALEDALETTDAVIVDMLWVESTDASGIAALVAGLQRATRLGKSLIFQSMSTPIRAALEAEWNRQRLLSLGAWQDQFAQELEGFLDNLLQNPCVQRQFPPNPRNTSTNTSSRNTSLQP